MKAYILAHDLGTTGDKATLYDREGKLHGAAVATYGTDLPHAGWAEQDPNAWWQAVCDSTRKLLAETGIRGDEIACITFSGQMQGAVALDRHARPLRSALIWMDQRATEQTKRMEDSLGADRVYRITGNRLSAAYTLHKILWMRDHQPEIFAATHKFVCAKDAIVARLTGEFVTDPSDASGMNCYDLEAGAWSAEILDDAKLDVAKLPTLRRSIDVVGSVRAEVADEIGLPAGTPVVLGGGDGPCASVGAGSIREHVVYSYIGSSSWIATASTTPIYDPQQRTFTLGHVVPGLMMPLGTMQTAGAAYQWTRDQLGQAEIAAAEQTGDKSHTTAYTLMNELAAQSPAGANSLLFLPYLAGERSPRWNPAAKAAFIGLTLRHTRADMFRAVMEGVALNLTVILKAFQAQGSTVEAVRVIGGGSTSRVWMQIMADCFGVPIQRLQVLEEATSMGAAVVGGVGIGMYPDFGIADQMNSIADSLAPNTANRETYAHLYQAFEASYRALVPIYDMLNS